MTHSSTQEHPKICNVCGGKVILIKTKLKYSRSGYIYKCLKCGASVGTHPNTTNALGTLGDKEMKSLRREAHVWFDKLYRNHEDRQEWYDKLAAELGIEKENCHFAWMPKEMLETAIKIIKKWWLEKYDK